MSHYAKVVDSIVEQVIVAEPEFIESFVSEPLSFWIQTSYNTRGGIHYGPDGNPDGGVALRGNYAGIGFIYDQANDVFYAPQPFPSWLLDNTDWTWKPPVAAPLDGKPYRWDEDTTSWVEIINPGATPIVSVP